MNTLAAIDHVEFTDTPTAVYRLYDAGGVLLYVGMTCNLRQRMASHAQSQPWWPLVARKTMRWYGSEQGARTAEAVAIRDESPTYNTLNPLAEGHRPYSRHRTPLLAWHPPAELAAWVRAEAERRGVTVSVVLTEALAEKKAKAES